MAARSLVVFVSGVLAALLFACSSDEGSTAGLPNDATGVDAAGPTASGSSTGTDGGRTPGVDDGPGSGGPSDAGTPPSDATVPPPPPPSPGDAALPPGSCTFHQGDNSCTMQHDGVTRHYIVHVPVNFVPGQSALLLALHPSQATGSGFETNSGWSKYADALTSPQPIVVFPTALLTAGNDAGETPHTAWNANTCQIFPQPCPDDSDFIRQIILAVANGAPINAKAVFVMGFSDGSLMADWVGVQNADLVAGVGCYEFPSSKTAGLGGPPIPNATAPVSVVYVDGDHHPIPNICGFAPPPQPDPSRFQGSVDQDMAYWANPAIDNCTTFDTTSTMCTGQYDPQGYGMVTGLMERTASGCAAGTEVKIYRLKGGIHIYYCSNNSGCSPVVDFLNAACDSTTPCNPTLNSTTGTTLNDLFWNFFSTHLKP